MKNFMFLLIVIAAAIFGSTVSESKSHGELVGYWTFDGDNANDFTGNYNGTVIGSGVTFPAGKVGKAVNFSVGTSCIKIPSFNTDNITVEAWIYPTKYGYYTSMVTKNYYPSGWSSPYAVWQMWLAENTAVPGVFSSQCGVNSPQAISMSQWYHMAFTYDGTTSKLYVNGEKKAESTTSAGNLTSTAGNIYIGKPESSNHSYTGSIDEVAIWDYALQESDIQQHYQNGLAGLGYITAPIVSTGPLTDITMTSAVSGGNITSDGGSEVTAKGVCWNTTGNPTTDDLKTEDGTGAGEFTSTLTELTPGTTYFVKAYSVNAMGTSYGEEISFTTTSYFTDINAGLYGVYNSSVDWGDYDNDGDLDILLTGYTGSVKISRIYRNNPGTFSDLTTGMEGIYESSAAWGDYDNDGDLDILMTGNSYYGRISRIYPYEGLDWDPPFDYHTVSLEGVRYSSVDWGDYDNDGDLDILLTGQTALSQSISRIYINDGGSFTNYIPLEGVSSSSVAWGDYDNDGDLDILLTGFSGSGYISRIYRNDSGSFADINAGLEGVSRSSVAWGDYDNDGDLDVLLTGLTASSQSISRIYRNDTGTFTGINSGLEGVFDSSAAWGDYDNDGDLDVLLTGASLISGHISRIYRNDSGSFTDINAGMEGARFSSAAWGDYDNDGDLDILLTGMDGWANAFSRIYRNNCVTPNSVPSQPSNLEFTQDANGLYFNFDPATDAETLSSGLSYNIDINIGDGTVKAASSDFTTGFKRVTSMGNIQQNTSYTLHAQAPPEMIPQQLFDMTWKVQAVDNCFAGSSFASKNDMVMNRELVTVPKEIMVATDALTWEYYMPYDLIAGYTLQLSGDSLFSDPFEFFMPASKENKAIYIGIDLQSLGVVDSLENNGKYFWRVKPEHVDAINNPTGFKKVPDSFIYDPVYSAPSPVNISVEGNYVTLQWGTGKEAEKGMLYNIYSSDNPHAVFPSGWTLVNTVTGTSYVLNSTVKKKFYCVTAAGNVK